MIQSEIITKSHHVYKIYDTLLPYIIYNKSSIIKYML